MDRNISPEEKLLRLIRGRPKKELDKESGKEPVVASSAQKKLKIRFNYFRSVKNFFKTHLVGALSFKTLNIFLVFLLVASFIYFGVDLLTPLEGKIRKISQPAEDSQEQQEIKIARPQSYDYYYKQFSRRDIFSAPLTAKTEASAVSANLQDIVKNFRLVGVILGKQPQAIIEDKNTKMTYFLNKGDSLDKLQIKDILESKVILSSAGEDIELGL